MKIQNISNTDFRGIKLSSNKYNKVKEMALHLQKTGFENLGHKSVFCNNTFSDKVNKIKQIRNLANFSARRFGALFLPWSGEAYIIASPEYEQFMFPVIKQYDKGAQLNLAI